VRIVTASSAVLDDLLDVAGRMAAADVLVAVADEEIAGTVTRYADGHGLGMSWPPGWSVSRALAVTPPRRSHGRGRPSSRRAWSRGQRRRGARAAHGGVHVGRRRPLRAVRLASGPTVDITLTDVFDVAGDDLPSVIAYCRDVS
jgi:hypothetical protein